MTPRYTTEDVSLWKELRAVLSTTPVFPTTYLCLISKSFEQLYKTDDQQVRELAKRFLAEMQIKAAVGKRVLFTFEEAFHSDYRTRYLIIRKCFVEWNIRRLSSDNWSIKEEENLVSLAKQIIRPA